jgi:hypothetical protein
MHDLPHCPIAPAIAARLRAAREEIAARWLARIAARVNIAPDRVFPSDALLNHVPLLVDGIAAFVEAPAAELDAEAPVTAKARELGALRYAQGFDAYQVLKEHELLGAVLLAFVEESVDGLATPCAPRELVACLRRVAHAAELIRRRRRCTSSASPASGCGRARTSCAASTARVARAQEPRRGDPRRRRAAVGAVAQRPPSVAASSAWWRRTPTACTGCSPTSRRCRASTPTPGSSGTCSCRRPRPR